jgi:glyoxylase-like metal-dependent hydrolase (beta-lactamase superfamily II)
MKIIDHIWQVGGSSLTAEGDAAIYLIACDTAAALVDAGCGRGHEKLVMNILQHLQPETELAYLFLTHCHFDHAGGASLIKKHFGCTLVAHEHDAVFLESADSIATAARWYGADIAPILIDHKITEAEEVFKVGNSAIHAFHTPGHSPGSLVYLTEVDGKKVLFGQDIHGPLHPELRSNQNDYINSLKFLLSLEADILCEGHFGVYRGKAAVHDFIASFLP